MGFSRQEYWSGLPFPSPEDLLTQESNPGLLHCRQILYRLSYKKVLAHKTSPNSLAFSTGLPSSHPDLPSSCPGLLSITDFSFLSFFLVFIITVTFKYPCTKSFLVLPAASMSNDLPPAPWDGILIILLIRDAFPTVPYCPPQPLIQLSFLYRIYHSEMILCAYFWSSVLISKSFISISYARVKFHEGKKNFLSCMLRFLQRLVQDWQVVSAQLIFATKILRIIVK